MNTTARHGAVSVRMMDWRFSEDSKTLELDLRFTGTVQDENGRKSFDPPHHQTVTIDVDSETPYEAKPGRRPPLDQRIGHRTDHRQGGAI